MLSRMIERKRICDACHVVIPIGEAYVQVSSDLRRDEPPPSTCSTSIIDRVERELHSACAVSCGYVTPELLIKLRERL